MPAALLPDGMPFQMPDCDALPRRAAIGGRVPAHSRQPDVLLRIPVGNRKAQTARLSPGEHGVQTLHCRNCATYPRREYGGDERPVRMGRKNIRLLLDTEPCDGLVVVPIARVSRDGSGHFMYDPDFVPPCLQISASEALMLLTAAADRNSGSKERHARPRSPAPASSADFSTREIANFWLLHAVNSALAPLRHLWISKRGHPEELFWKCRGWRARSAHSRWTRIPARCRSTITCSWANASRRWTGTSGCTWKSSSPPIASPSRCARWRDYFYEGEIDGYALSGTRALGFRHSRGDGRGGTDHQRTPQLVKICLEQIRRRTGAARHGRACP